MIYIMQSKYVDLPGFKKQTHLFLSSEGHC